jgi:hypothetical protein
MLDDSEATAGPAPAAVIEPAVAAQPAPAATVPVPPPATDEAWPEPIQPSPEAERAVEEIATSADKTVEKPKKTVAAKPRPTIRRSPPKKRTPPPTPAPADTEDLYDSR